MKKNKSAVSRINEFTQAMEKYWENKADIEEEERKNKPQLRGFYKFIYIYGWVWFILSAFYIMLLIIAFIVGFIQGFFL